MSDMDKRTMTDELLEKPCTRCDEVKPLYAFMLSKKSANGRGSWCKDCHNRYSLEWQRKNVDKVRPKMIARQKAWYEKNKDKVLNRPITEKSIARRILRNAVSNGKIIKPSKCENCKTLCAKRNIEGHHNDYSKPLKVKWLCQGCHGKIHRAKLS